MTALSITGLAKRFGATTVLQDVALDMPAGELVAILGASGSGKTTLLRLICGFERADAGRIAIGGAPVSDAGLHVAPERRRVGYVAQEGALFPHLTVGENIAFGLPRAERRAARSVAALLELVGLPAAWAARPPHQLSGGEQQRLALARALAPRPRLVLLDEPFSALDAALRADTRQAVAGALAAAGATALLVTHDQSEALSMGHRVGVLRRGRLVQLATPEELYRKPVDAELARFVGDAVLLPGTAADGWATCALGRLPLAGSAPEGPVTVLVRPEQILLGTAGMPARVTAVTFYGHDAAIGLQLQAAPRLTLSARIAGHAIPHVGDAIAVSVAGPVLCFAEL